MKSSLNLRDLGGIPLADGKGRIPKGLFLRSGKLSVLTSEECARLCQKHNITTVIDLRTDVEAEEFPDPLPPGVEYQLIPLLRNSAIGITHETGSDPMTILRRMRKHPEEMIAMMPDFKKLYHDIVTDEYSASQLEKVVAKLRNNAAAGRCTLFHCTAGKDRTGITTMALLRSYGVSDENIVKDFCRTNRSAFFPALRKSILVFLLTWNFMLAKAVFRAFIADKQLLAIALQDYHRPQ